MTSSDDDNDELLSGAEKDTLDNDNESTMNDAAVSSTTQSVTKSFLYFLYIIYPFECETYTNICLQ